MHPEGRSVTKINCFISSTLLLWALFCFPVNTSKKATQGGPGIAYGGVLNRVTKTTSNDTSIQHAARFALSFAAKRHPTAIPFDKGKQILPFTISKASTLKLIYTHNGLVPGLSEVLGSDGKYYSEPVMWGYTYHFTVSWPHDSPWVHSFCVTKDWDEQHHIYQHTFHRNSSYRESQSNELRPADIRLPQSSISVILATAENSDSVTVTPSGRVSQLTSDNRVAHSSKSFFSLFQSPSDSRQTCQVDQWVGPGQNPDPVSCDEVPHSETNSDYLYTHDKDLTGVHSSTSSPNMTQTLTVLSYNIWNTNTVRKQRGEYRTRLKRIGKLLQEVNADVIAVQEVRFQDQCCDDMGPNQMEHLAEHLPQYQFIYQPGQIQMGNFPDRVEEGVAFFSKYPISKHRAILLSRDENDVADGHQRVLLHILVNTLNGGKVHLLNTHLSLSHIARARSVREIWKHVQHLDGPVLFMGDLNAETHNVEVKFLDGRSEINNQVTQGFHDVWRMKYGTEKGFTFNTLEESLSKRIDLMFMRDHPAIALDNVQVIDDGGRGPNAASDHLGLLASFVMKSQSPSS